MTVTISRTAAQVDRIQALVEHVDITAREMDTKWGVGRLRLLVPPTCASDGTAKPSPGTMPSGMATRTRSTPSRPP